MELNTITLLLNFMGAFSSVIVLPIVAFMGLISALIGLRWGVSRFIFWVIGDGTTSGFSRQLHKISGSAGAWYDHMTYRPFKGAPRGWQIRAGQRFGIKKWQV